MRWPVDSKKSQKYLEWLKLKMFGDKIVEKRSRYG